MGRITLIFASCLLLARVDAFSTSKNSARITPTFANFALTTPPATIKNSPVETALFQSMEREMAVATPRLTTGNPLALLVEEIKAMDIDAFINTAIMVAIAATVLAKLTMINHSIGRGWTAEEMAIRIPIDNWDLYNDILSNHPVQTKAVTSATVYTIGDVIAQRSEGSKMGELDRPRILRSLLAGLIGHGPLSHFWYERSEGVFTDVLHLTAWWSFVPKIVVDQTTWGPIWNNSYILLLGLMKRESLSTIWGDVKRTTIPLIVSGLKLWPLAHCITYGLIPVENRLLWVDMVEILWVTILATSAAGAHVTTTEEKTD